MFPVIAKLSNKLWLLVVLTLTAIGITCLLKAIRQNSSYHLFADERNIAGIPNFLNVITNLPFVIIGIYGLYLITNVKQQKLIAMIYCALFLGIILTGFGSAYYHYNPNNATLVFDRFLCHFYL